MPAFLFKDLALGIEQGMQDRVHIDIHKVEEIALIGAGHRIHGLVGERQCIKKGLHRCLEEIDKRLFYRITLTAA